MAGIIVVDRIESDASYASSINIASPIQISNTITGNVNFDSGTLFVDAVNNRVGIGTQNPVVGLQVTNSSGGGQIRVVSSDGNILQLISDSSEASIRAVAGVPLTFRTSNEDRMLIDASGRITMPHQPSFTVGRATRINSTGVVVYGTTSGYGILHNRGGHYNTTNGRFTAPVTGSYYFGFAALVLLGAFEIEIRVNGASGVQIRKRHESNNASIQGSVIAKLNVNDFVEINAPFILDSADTQPNDSRLFQYFTGYLIG